MVSLRASYLPAFLLLLKICHSFGQTSFRVTQTSNESITVAWVDTASLVNFSLALNSAEVYSATGQASSPYKVGGLQPGTLYHLQVDALHENGTQLVLLDTNTHTKPNPAENVEVRERTTGSITVTWQAPSVGDLSYYIAKLQEVTSSEKNVSKTDKQATFTGLDAAGKYTVVIETVMGDQIGNAVMKIIYTKPAAPTAVQVTAHDAEIVMVTWTPATNKEEVSFQVSYQVAGGMKTLTSCQVSGCGLTMSVKAGQPVTVLVTASIDGVTSDEASATGNTKPLPPGYMQVVDRGTESLTLAGLLPAASSVSDDITVEVTPSPSYLPQHRVSGTNYSVTALGLKPGTSYTITVATVSGREHSNSTEQTFYTRPTKPAAVTRHATTTDTLTVTWSEPAGGMFTQYVLNIRRSGTSNVIKISKVAKSALRQQTFEGLKPGEMYEVILQTEISGVYSDPATSSLRTKPKKPRNVYVSLKSVNSLKVSWEAPSAGIHTGYLAELVGVKSQQEVSGESIEYTELNAGTAYTSVIRTVSGDQTSDPQQDVFYTNPEHPKWLNKTELTSSSTIVEWGRPDAGSYDGFRLTLLTSGQDPVYVNLNMSEMRHQFSTLQPATRYTVKVAARADTVYSTPVDLIFTTRPKPPRNLHTLRHDTSSVEFAWDAPDQTVSVDSYRSTVTKSDTSPPADYVEHTSQRAESTNLTPGGTYVIKVRAVKNGVESTSTDGLRVTLTPDNPSGLRATNVGQTSIELQWNDPEGDFDGFIVELKRDSSVVNRTLVDRSTKTVEIQDLQPDHRYTAVVYSLSSGQQSSGASISLTTMSLGTVTLELQQRSTTSITVGWMKASGEVTYYELQVVAKDGGPTKTTEIQAGRPLQHEFSALEPGRTYTFTISVVASGMKGTGSSRDITTNPSAVQSLSVHTLTTDTVRVQWQVKADSTQQEFQVQYKLQSGTTTKDIRVPYETGQLTYIQHVTGLAPGHTYDITVAALSNHISGAQRTGHNTTRPLPVSLRVEVLSPELAALAWAGGEGSQQDHYQVRYKGEMVSTQWSSVQLVNDGTETNMTDLTPGDLYLFEVTALSVDQKSDPATETGTMYPLPPSSVEVVTSETTSSRVKVSWTYEYSQRSYWTHWLVVYGQVGSAATLSQTLQDVNLSTYTVDNLLAGYNYTVQVYTVTVNNVTSLSPAMVNATVRPVITTEMLETVEQTTTDTLAFNYTEETGSGTFDHYVFTLQDTPHVPPVIMDRGDLARKVMFHGLQPGHEYWVVARTVSGAERSTTKRLKIFTVPHMPEAKCIGDQSSITLVLNQMNGSASHFDVVCGKCHDSQHRQVRLEEHSTRFNNLEPFTYYTFDVRSLVGQDPTKYSAVFSIHCNTSEGRPHQVEEFTLTNVKPYEVTLTWVKPLVTNGHLKKYVITYNGTKQFKDRVKDTIEVTETEHSYTVEKLKAGYMYEFEIRAYTGNSQAGDAATLKVTLPVQAPYIALPDIAKATPALVNDSVTISSFKMEFVNPFSDKNGAIVGYSIVVTTDRDLKDLAMADLPNWSHRQTGDAVLYVAVEKCPNFFTAGDTCWSSGVMKRSVSVDRVVVTVGGDPECDENDRDPCNGKLTPGTTYYTMLRAYTEGNLFANTPFSQGVTTAERPVNVAVIVVPIVVCLLLVIVVAVIVVLRRRGTFSKKARPECPIFIGTLQQPAHRSKTDDSSRPIKLTDFPEHWKTMNADAQFKFAEEYEDLKEVGREQVISAAELPANRMKNRFSNILPYDNTRVRLLQGDEEEEGTDYINASWIPGYNSKREYIVTQGPLPSTRDDLWRVVWEQNVQSIVMLTKCVEKGRDKCDHYWPVDSEPMFYGDIQVMILNETKCTEWIVTEFKISSGGRSRNLKHFHYTAWPDFGVPDNPRSLIGFVRLVRSKLKTTEGPTIVHCSAGVGRSGTFIVLDRMLQHLQEHDYVDIFGTVYEMRKYRHWMVQTEQQYICSHRCLLYVIEGREFDDADSDGEANKAFEVDEGIES